MNEPTHTDPACGCCAGVTALTPEPTANRPGLDALRTRIGTHATFWQSMVARLGTMTIPVIDENAPQRALRDCTPAPRPPDDETEDDEELSSDASSPDDEKTKGVALPYAAMRSAPEPAAGSSVAAGPVAVAAAIAPANAPTTGAPAETFAPLRALTTRRLDDAAIALLDAWAVVGDVLTFYQERHANEGYLRTAVERRSVLELARLVGYRPRPGVSATVYLSFMLENSFAEETTIPAGTKAQSQPATSDEKAQIFETMDAIVARASWNRIRPRQTQPQALTSVSDELFVAGVDLPVRPGDRLLLDFGDDVVTLRQVAAVEAQRDAGRTRLSLVPGGVTAPGTAEAQGAMAMAATAPLAFTAAPAGNLGQLFKQVIAALDEMEEESELLSDPHGRLIEILLLVMDAAESGRPEALSKARQAIEKLDDELKAIVENDGDTEVEAARLLREFLAALFALLPGGEVPPPQANDIMEQLAHTLSASRAAAAVPPATAAHLSLDAAQTFGALSDVRVRLLASTLGGTAGGRAALQTALYQAARAYGLMAGKQSEARVIAAGADAPAAPPPRVYLARPAAPFGHNAPLRAKLPVATEPAVLVEWEIAQPLGNDTVHPHHKVKELYLDADYDVVPDRPVFIQPGAGEPLAFRPEGKDIGRVTLAAYGLNSGSTRLVTPSDWFAINDTFPAIRATRVYLAGDELTLAEAPIADPVPDAATPRVIELNGVYEGLTPGRWLVVSGERADLGQVRGVMASELVMIDNATITGGGDDRPRTVLTFANELEYLYRRESVVLLANTVRAGHGETTTEVLGSGDARRRWATYALRRPPLTYVPAPTAAGAESTLTVRVNGVRWGEADNHTLLGPADRAYVLERREEREFDATQVIFGDGANGARLPTGVENVTAVYRSGLGRAGNVAAGRIKQLATRPLGVKDVINALPATGGADREGRDQARANAPLALMALDRLVSTQDYADFARIFAGIAKAAATELSDGRRTVVHLTIAGADDIPIDPTSDLYRNLRLALVKAGDPWTPIVIAMRALKSLVIAANVRPHPDYLWEDVARRIRARLYEVFSFGGRELGQDATAGEVIAAIHGVPGVLYADLDVLDGLSGDDLATQMAALAAGGSPRTRVKAEMARRAPRTGTLLPAELIYLDARVPETLILKEVTQ